MTPGMSIPPRPLFGISIALFGALVLTPDTLLMRLSGFSTFQMLAWRGTLMGLVMLCVWLATRRGRLRADLAALMTGAGLAAILCQGANATLFAAGIATAPVPLVLFGVATVPVFSALFARIALGEPTRPATWVTIAAVLSGIALAVFGKDTGGVGLNPASLRGALFGLGVAAMLALSFTIFRRHTDLPIPLAIGCGALLAGLAGTTLAGPETLTDGRVWAIAITGAVILPISFFTLSLASRHTQAANVSLILLLETILGPFWIWVGLGTAPTTPMILGGVVVVTSLAAYLAHSRRRPLAVAAG